MKKLILLGLIVLVPLVNSGHAIVFGGSNLMMMDYPSHDCGFKPTKPYRPSSFSSQWEIDSYNAKVRQFNDEMETFVDCIEEYLDNCSNDIKRIKEKMQEAINDVEM